MKDLVAQTGATREAIRFYINEGLLPAPLKTSRNMAWYSREHVARVRYIRALQEEHFLPLKAIRSLINGQGAEQFSAQQLHQFEVLRLREEARHVGEQRRQLASLARELDLSVQEQVAARAQGMVNDDGSVGPADEELLRLWVAQRAEGLTPERGFSPADMQSVQDAVDLLFAKELSMFTERLGDMSDEELGHVLDRIVPNVNRTFALLHERKLRQFLAAIPAVTPADQEQGDSP